MLLSEETNDNRGRLHWLAPQNPKVLGWRGY
jgi:hypothetical protein